MVRAPSSSPNLPRPPLIRRWLPLAGLAVGIVGAMCSIVLLIQIIDTDPRFALLALCLGMLACSCTLVIFTMRLSSTINRLQVYHDQQREEAAAWYQRVLAQTEDRVNQSVNAAAASSEALRRLITHLVDARLPAAAARTPVPAAPYEPAIGDDLVKLLDGIVDTVSALVTQQQDHREALHRVLIALARRVQPSAHRIQNDATKLAEAYLDDDLVQATAMRIDHAAAQQARAAQCLAVLCGDWPGQHWRKPYSLVEIVRAASGRILDYQRIKVIGDPTLAATAAVVEHLIHLVAELLANATACSPPRIMVEAEVRQVQRGAVIIIDDAGIGMDEHRLSHYNAIASGERLPALEDLADALQTGLHVVGILASRHGFRVTLTHSPLGGVRAVVLVPDGLVEILDPEIDPDAQHPAMTAPPSMAVTPPTRPATAAEPALRPDPATLQAAAAAAPPLPQRRASRRNPQPPDRRTAQTARPAAPPLPASRPEPDRGDFLAEYLQGAQPTPADTGQPAGPSSDPVEGNPS